MPNRHPSRSWRGCAMCKPDERQRAGCAAPPEILSRQFAAWLLGQR